MATAPTNRGELPTNRLGGLVHPGDFNGISGGNVHL